MFEVCDDRDFSFEAALLSVRYYDRYVHFVDEPIARDDLQLAAVAALLLASRFEDTCPVDARDLEWLTDYAYSAAEIVDQEIRMLRVLDDRLMLATESSFLCDAACGVSGDAVVAMAVLRLARRFVEKFHALVSTATGPLPSEIARAAVELARELLVNTPRL